MQPIIFKLKTTIALRICNMIFSEVWLPNILSCLVGIATTAAAARWINSNGSKRNAKVMDAIIRILAEQHRVELVTDADGRPTGGQVIRLAGDAAGQATVTASLTTGSASIAGTGSVDRKTAAE
jgi:hypothetical protein